MALPENSDGREEAAPSSAQGAFPTVGDQAVEVDTDNAASKVVEEIESLCMNCHENGTTRLLLTRIPYFREIILSSFACAHCGFDNVEVQAAGEIQAHGVAFSLRIDHPSDLQRQIVKSDTAACRLDALDLEIPAGRGRLTSVEGLIRTVAEDLVKGQAERRRAQPELAARLDAVIRSIAQMADGAAFPFSISLDDPAGNSSIEPSPDDVSGKYRRTEYRRRPEQNAALGLAADAAAPPDGANGSAPGGGDGPPDDGDILAGRTYALPCACPGCARPASVDMQLLDIPHFRQVVLSAVSCAACGYRSSEVKTGGAIPARGQRIYLTVTGPRDLARDLLKSATCAVRVPACGLEVQPGTLGGRFTTVEGLLAQVRDDLRKSIFDVDGDGGGAGGGDARPAEQRGEWARFFAQLDAALRAEREFELCLEDPLGASYVQSLTAPAPDPQLREETYERTTEEDEELGLADMKTVQNEHGEYVKESV